MSGKDCQVHYEKNFYVDEKSDPQKGKFGFETGVHSAKFGQTDNGSQLKYKAATAGGKVNVGDGKFGGELKATAFEFQRKTGNASATLGLKADTGASIGSKRTGGKVLGTGGYIGTEGIDVSLFGTGIKFKF